MRLFTAKDKSKRRDQRSGRLQRRRLKLRLSILNALLSSLPQVSREDRVKTSHIYQLRAEGLDRRLEPEELRAVLFHLAKKRGFRSNRKYKSKNDEEKGLKLSITETQKSIEEANARTYGEYLFFKSQKDPNAVLRCKKLEDSLSHYADRDMVKQEFSLIRSKQESYYSQLDWDQIQSVLFFQRDLKPAYIGKCSIFAEEERLPRSSLLALQFVMLQDLSHLRIHPKNQPWEIRALTLEEIQKVLPLCSKQQSTTHKKILQTLKLDKTHAVKESDEQKDKIQGMWENDLWKDKKLSDETKEQVLDWFNDEKNDNVTSSLLAEGFDKKDVQEFLNINLPTGYIKFSKKAVLEVLNRFWDGHGTIGKIIADLRKSKDSTLLAMSSLDYYGKSLKDVPNVHLTPPCGCKNLQQCPHSISEIERQYGRSPNNVQHVAFNQ